MIIHILVKAGDHWIIETDKKRVTKNVMDKIRGKIVELKDVPDIVLKGMYIRKLDHFKTDHKNNVVHFQDEGDRGRGTITLNEVTFVKV